MLDLNDWQNKKYTTRNGKPVRILCIDMKQEHYQIVGLVSHDGKSEEIETWTIDGRYRFVRSEGESLSDLINAKTKCEGWVNLSRDPAYPAYAGFVYPTEKLAKAYESTDRIATIRIEWEE